MNVWVILLLNIQSLLLATILLIPFFRSIREKWRREEIKKWIPQGVLTKRGYDKGYLKKLARQGKIEERYLKTADGQAIKCYKFPKPEKKK